MERFYSIDSMKCIAIFTVVYFHTISFNGSETEDITLSLLIFPRYVIPFFFIVSGFLFGQKILNSLNPIQYFKSYSFSLVRLFIGWFLFYILYDFILRVFLAIFLGYNLENELAEYFKSLPNMSVIYYGVGITGFHLWYLTALIWAIVLLSLFIKIKKLHILLIISFILNLIGLFGQTYSGLIHLPIDTRDALFFGLFYVTLGCFISLYYEKIKQRITNVRSYIFICIIMLSCILQVCESLLTVKLLNGTKGGIGYYLSTIPLTISLFLFTLKKPNLGRNSILTKIGKNTNGIYVTHMLFISLFFLLIQYFNVAYLRNNITFNIIFASVIFFLSHLFYLYTSSFREKMSNFLFYRLSKVISDLVKKIKISY